MAKRVVLMYHDLYLHSPSESGFQNRSAFQYKIQVDEFENQVKNVVQYCREHPEIEVEFTFDDGGVSFLTLVAPVLEKYGLRGTFFISTAYLNTPLFLTMGQLRELVERGHRIGSHSHTHPQLTDLEEKSIVEEWKRSIEILKDFTSNDGITASIPNGDGNKLVMQKAAEVGIRVLYTSIPTTRVTSLGNMQILGRYVVFQGMTVKDIMTMVTNRSRRRILYSRWLCLWLVKKMLGNHYNSLKQLLFKAK